MSGGSKGAKNDKIAKNEGLEASLSALTADL
jgi:hypothetical protein